ncbi:ABC transporter ATP-binding protein, partial [Streptomyces brasiliscabiei]
QTEKLINSAIVDYAKEHLVLVIAHRLNTITNADNIYVLEQGKIIEQGNYQQLYQQHGKLWQLAHAGAQHD